MTDNPTLAAAKAIHRHVRSTQPWEDADQDRYLDLASVAVCAIEAAPAPPEPTPATPLERLSAALDGYDEVQDNSIREVPYDVAALAAAARGLVEAPTPPAPEEPFYCAACAGHGADEHDPGCPNEPAPPVPEPPPEPDPDEPLPHNCLDCAQGLDPSQHEYRPPPAPSGPLGQQDPDLVERALRAGDLTDDDTDWSRHTVTAVLRGLGWPGGDEVPVWLTRENAEGLASRHDGSPLTAACRRALAVPTEAPEAKP